MRLQIFVLLPVTCLAWFVLMMFVAWGSLMVSLYVFTINWLVLMLLYGMISYSGIAIISFFPFLVGMFIGKLYGHSKIAGVSHAIFGLLGVIGYYVGDAVLSGSNILSAGLFLAWEIDPTKTIAAFPIWLVVLLAPLGLAIIPGFVSSWED